MKQKAAGLINIELFVLQAALAAIGCYYYGLRVLVLCAMAAITCFLVDYLCIFCRKIPYRAAHLDSVCTGMTLALLMPASVSYDILIISCIVAIIIGKQLFGGRTNLLFPPAAVGYLFAMLSWSKELLQFPAPYTALPMTAQVDVLQSASLSSQYNYTYLLSTATQTLLRGEFAGPIGETPILLLVVGGIVLLLRRSISPSVTISTLGTVALLYAIFPSVQATEIAVRNGMFMNGILFCTIFLLADVRLAPRQGLYGCLYGATAGMFFVYFSIIYDLEYGAVIISVLLAPLAIVMQSIEQAKPTQPPKK